MALNIVPPSEPIAVSHCVVMGYADPGSGKTSFGYSCSRPLLFNFDAGAHRTAFRRGGTVPITKWADVTMMHADDFKDYDTVIIDTVGTALEFLTAHMIANDYKMGNNTGGPSQRGWGKLKADWSAFLAQLRTFGLDVVLLAHAKEVKDGEITQVRPDIAGASYALCFQKADAVFYLASNRYMNFAPSDKWIGKDPASLGNKMNVPDYGHNPDFGEQVIEKIRDSLGKLSAEGAAVVAEVEAWRENIASCDDAECLTAHYESARKKDLSTPVKVQVQGLLRKRAAELNCVFDKDAGAFVAQADDSTDAATEAGPEGAAA